jgi:hypothetical protein
MRWLLGMGNFSLMPTEPGDDPMQRLMLRLRTTIEGLVAVLVTLLVLLVAGIVALATEGPDAVVMVVIVGSAAALLLVARSAWRSKRARISVPGLAWVAGVMNLAMVATAILLLLRAQQAAG